LSASFDELIKAKTLLGLHEKATLSEVKFRYKNLMQQWHPDKHPENNKQATQMSAHINNAYKIVLEYIKTYEFPFDEEHLRDATLTPEEWWHRKFGQR